MYGKIFESLSESQRNNIKRVLKFNLAEEKKSSSLRNEKSVRIKADSDSVRIPCIDSSMDIAFSKYFLLHFITFLLSLRFKTFLLWKLWAIPIKWFCTLLIFTSRSDLSTCFQETWLNVLLRIMAFNDTWISLPHRELRK